MSTPPPYGGGVFIADKSAWKVARHASVQVDWVRAMRDGQIAITSIVRLELLYSARDQAEFEALEEELDTLPSALLNEPVCEAAIRALHELAGVSAGYHRVKPPDALIAAAAQDRGWGVLHYDHHFDRLAQVLHFDGRWIAPAGSI